MLSVLVRLVTLAWVSGCSSWVLGCLGLDLSCSWLLFFLGSWICLSLFLYIV
uniref:Uncharacterized protein n=1 Tax=Manihot esculenta TaxID=3983 RepID=A0A2C9UB76_MANES